MYAKVATIEIYAKRLGAFFVAVIALSALLYGIFLLIAVERTSTRTSAENQAASLGSSLGLLQSQYLADTANITPEQALALGFVVPPAGAVVYASAATGALSLNNGRN